jgi:dTDP-4-dehydrorhamnose 3,5-epimerase
MPERTFTKGPIEGVVVRQIRKYIDDRGWLAELFRDDELSPELQPVMSYLSLSAAGVTRGPHEHVHQTDLFCFVGPSNFKLRLWDNRPTSPTHNNVMTVYGGVDAPLSVLVPAGVVHGYRNVGAETGAVINCPNRLYMGEGRRQPVDEIRHEVDKGSPFSMEEE